MTLCLLIFLYTVALILNSVLILGFGGFLWIIQIYFTLIVQESEYIGICNVTELTSGSNET